jgi:hypothetical protein
MDLCVKRIEIDFDAYKVRLMELNSFSCAGLYDSDLEKVVKAVSNRAETDWEASKDE